MKLTSFVMLAAVAMSHGAAVMYTQSFDAVEVVPPAKSRQIVCKTRADVNEGLVRNYDCDAAEIEVLNADHMWIGSLDAIPAHESRKYQEFDDGRYRHHGKFIEVKYYSPTADASDDNINMVICPAGMIPFMEGNAYTCVKPYQCEEGEYAEDKYSCATLPENAHRTHTIGYECNPGARKNDAGDCIVPPENAHWMKDGTFKCNAGLIMFNDACVEPAICKEPERYDSTANACVTLPANAHWNNLSNVDPSWSCDDAFILLNNQCEHKALCDVNQRYVSEKNICVTLPAHAHWTNSWDNKWECDERYVVHSPDMTSPSSYYCKLADNCADPNTHWNSYYNWCEKLPENAHWTSERGTDWECNADYILSNLQCIKKEVCNPESQRYIQSTNSCVTLPNNATWSYDDGPIWECNTGFIELNGHCEQRKECWFGNRLDESTNTCISKPAHSSWLDSESTSWYCDTDYYKDGNECKSNPWLMKEHVSYGARFVFNAAAGEAWTENANGSNEFAATVSVGVDLYLSNLGNNVSAAFVPSMGYLLFDTYDATAHIFRMEFGSRLSVGSSVVHGYIMPLVILNLGGSVTLHQHDGRDIVIQADPYDYSLGNEIGLSIFTDNWYRWDVYCRFESTPVSVTYINRGDWLVMGGIRLGI